MSDLVKQEDQPIKQEASSSAQPMPADTVIVAAIEKIVRGADLETLSAKSVRAQLEHQLGVDLTEKKDFIKAEIQKLLDALDAEDAAKAAAAPKRKAEAKAKPAAKSKPKAKKAKKSDEEGGPKKRTMFSRPLKLSADLQKVVGMEYSGRGNVVKAMWKYIKANKLQDPNDGRQILCDGLLTRIMKTAKVSMTTMNKALQPHFTKIEDEDELERAWQLVESVEAGAAGASSARVKKEEAADEEEDEEEEEDDEDEEDDQ